MTVDARNHGDSPHTDTMTYPLMASDLASLVQRLGLGVVSLAGHSMGGRTVMMAALDKVIDIDKLIVLDISPINQKFDVTSSNEWNMEHYFHCLKNVQFNQSLSVSMARRDADRQLALRIKEPGLRAWLLMNMRQDPKTKEIGWRINIDGIHEAFYKNIAKFPDITSSYSGYVSMKLGNIFAMKSDSFRPTLFIGGACSDYIPVTDHPEIQEIFPRAQFSYVQEAGHWVHSQRPADVIELMNNFL